MAAYPTGVTTQATVVWGGDGTTAVDVPVTPVGTSLMAAASTAAAVAALGILTLANVWTNTNEFSKAQTALAPAVSFTGAWQTGGSSTKPAVLIEPTGATSASWNSQGTALGINSTSGYNGDLLAAQLNGIEVFRIRALTSTTAQMSLAGQFNISKFIESAGDGAASQPSLWLRGAWFTGGTATTTVPMALVQPTGATSTAWNTAGTGIGVNAASGFVGYLQDLQLNGVSKYSVDYTGALRFAGQFFSTVNGALSAPAVSIAGTPITGGTGTTTKPLVLIETTGATSTAWSTSGTMLGVNAPSGFAGELLSLKTNNTLRFTLDSVGAASFGGSINQVTNVVASGSYSTTTSPSANGTGFKGTGTWFTGGTATTTKPYLLIEPTSTTSTGWNTSGTGIGINAASGFSGYLIDAQVNGVTKFQVQSSGAVSAGGTSQFGAINASSAINCQYNQAVGFNALGSVGTWASGGTSTTTKPNFLVEPSGTTSTGWNTNGTGVGVNAATGFTGNLIDLQLVGVSKFSVTSSGALTLSAGITASGGVTSAGTCSFSRGAASGSAVVSLTGAWFSGGTSTTTKPSFLVEASGATTTGWNTAGTGIGVNAATGFTGNLFDAQLNGVSVLALAAGGTLTFADVTNIATGTTTGTKIGTATSQKLSFWNKTPIVQPTTGISAAAFVANTSGIANDTATYGGYTIGQIAAALVNIGILA